MNGVAVPFHSIPPEKKIMPLLSKYISLHFNIIQLSICIVCLCMICSFRFFVPFIAPFSECANVCLFGRGERARERERQRETGGQTNRACVLTAFPDPRALSLPLSPTSTASSVAVTTHFAQPPSQPPSSPFSHLLNTFATN